MSTPTRRIFNQLIQLSAVCCLLLGTLSASAQVKTFYSKNIGNPVSGSAHYLCSVDEFNISADRAKISGSFDSFQFVHIPATGDIEVVARIEESSSSLSGLMIRSNDAANSSFAMVAVNGKTSLTRYRNGPSAFAFNGMGYRAGDWLRIRREGNLITSFVSHNGTDWIHLESRSLELGLDVLVGLAGVEGSVSFRDFEVIETIKEISILFPDADDPLIVAPSSSTEPDGGDSVPVENEEVVFNVSRVGSSDGVSGDVYYDEELDVFELTAIGGKTWGTEDDFEFVYREITGDVEVTVKVSGIDSANPLAKGGIMFRQTVDGDSMHSFLSVSSGKGVALERRVEIAGGTVRSAKGNVQAPVWLRLIKEGTYIHAYYSVDGDKWDFLSEDIIDLDDPILVGLAVAAEGEGEFVSGVFEYLDIVSLDVADGSETFVSADIGRVGVNGFSAYDAETDSFLVEAAGGDIGAHCDAFHYVYQEVTGDFTMVAYLEDLTAAEDFAKAGLMAREDYRPDSPYFGAFMVNNVGLAAQYRSSFGASTQSETEEGIETPVWLRILRRGSTFKAYYSTNGYSWTLIRSQTLNLPDTLLLGMALTSHEEGSLAFGEFGNISITLD